MEGITPQNPDAAKSFNTQLRVTAVAVAGASADGHAYGFLCECGCMGVAPTTLAEYEARGGSWIQGHEGR